MDNLNNPRHIRDIAHLYISRLAPASTARSTEIYVIAANRGCFGAYHTVNIALGFAQDGYAVRLTEVSGILPCCAYFLRLPPAVYMKHKARSPLEPLSALGGVTVRFAARGEVPAATGVARVVSPALLRGRPARAVDVYHLPPACDEKALERALESTEEGSDDRALAVVLAAEEAEAERIAARLFDGKRRVDWAVAALDGGRYGREMFEGAGPDPVRISGWRPLISDPVPCFVRDPQSRVSRSYTAVCRSLLSKIRYTEGEYETRKPQRAASLGQIR